MSLNEIVDRRIFYSSVIIGVTGTFFLFLMKVFHLAIGWWLGIVIGFINFSFLLSSLRNSQSSAGTKPAIGKFQKSFFLRYLLLAGAFFLIIQMGKQQLASSVLGFVSFYLALFIDYIFRLKKRKTGNL